MKAPKDVVLAILIIAGLLTIAITCGLDERKARVQMQKVWPEGLIVQHVSGAKGVVVGCWPSTKEVRVRFGLDEPKWLRTFELKPVVENKGD